MGFKWMPSIENKGDNCTIKADTTQHIYFLIY